MKIPKTEGLTRHHKANYKCQSCKKYFEEFDHLASHQCKTLRKDKQTGTQENIKIIHKNKSLLNKISSGKYLQCLKSACNTYNDLFIYLQNHQIKDIRVRKIKKWVNALK